MTVMRSRLSDKVLPSISEAKVPAYDRSRIAPGIVHLGIGAFHRAHQAVYVDDCLAAGDTGWGIIGASLRSPATRDRPSPAARRPSPDTDAREPCPQTDDREPITDPRLSANS